MTITIKEIAQLAGVSIGTVDRVLYRRGRVSVETKKKVNEIIERYQFTPNPIAKRLKSNKSYRFCALIPQRTADAGYWGQALTGLEDGAESLKPLGIDTDIIEYDRYNYGSFKNAAESVLTKNPDGVVFAPIMPKKTKPFLKILDARKIPYIFFDADIPEASPLCVTSHDSFKGGYLAGRLMHLFLGSVPESVRRNPVAVLDAHGEDYHLTRRRDGFLAFAEEYKIPTVTMVYSSEDGMDISEKEVTRFLNESPKLSGLFITNCMAHQVASAFPAHDFFIIGYDLIPANRRLLAEGRIDAIISQHPEEQGRTALLTLYRHIVLEQDVPSKKEIPLDIYLKENIPYDIF